LSVFSHEGLTAASVRSAQFREALRGYDPGVVDALLERIASALESGTAVIPMLKDVDLPTRLRGYRRDEVDAFLERLRRKAST
jgi:DivIVA domain-containing protein